MRNENRMTMIKPNNGNIAKHYTKIVLSECMYMKLKTFFFLFSVLKHLSHKDAVKEFEALETYEETYVDPEETVEIRQVVCLLFELADLIAIFSI